MKYKSFGYFDKKITDAAFAAVAAAWVRGNARGEKGVCAGVWGLCGEMQNAKTLVVCANRRKSFPAHFCVSKMAHRGL